MGRGSDENMHFWICPKCETWHLDEPVRCELCGFDNR